MEICGLTAEYNPFHIGHQRQLQLLRERLGKEAGLVVCMSGPFCQRGVPALLDKSRRAGLALSMGADLVLELPVAFAVASAERFAQGAVRTLLATGIVRCLAYGTEDPGRHDKIRQAGRLLADEPEELKAALRVGISAGKGFAAARQDALTRLVDDPDLASLLSHSNTILAVEYEKALARYGPIPSLALPLFDKEKTSATLIRDRIWQAVSGGPETWMDLAKDLAHLLPPPSLAAVMDAVTRDQGLLAEEKLALPLLLSPPFFDRQTLEKMEGMQGGLAGRLFRALRQDPAAALGTGERPYDRLVSSLANRAHPATRIRRAILAAALGLEAEDEALTRSGPAYLRVLGFNRRGRRLLSFMRKEAKLPVLTQASDFRRLEDPVAVRQAAFDLQAQALWNFHAGLSGESEFTREVLQLR